MKINRAGIWFLWIALLTVNVLSGDFNVSGTVKDGSGNPVANAVVSLVNAGKTTTTDTQGAFVLNAATMVTRSHSPAFRAAAALKGKYVHLDVPSDEGTVTISIYDLRGSCLFSFRRSHLSRGRYRAGLFAGLPSQVVSIRVVVGERAFTFKAVNVGKVFPSQSRQETAFY